MPSLNDFAFIHFNMAINDVRPFIRAQARSQGDTALIVGTALLEGAARYAAILLAANV